MCEPDAWYAFFGWLAIMGAVGLVIVLAIGFWDAKDRRDDLRAAKNARREALRRSTWERIAADDPENWL